MNEQLYEQFKRFVGKGEFKKALALARCSIFYPNHQDAELRTPMHYLSMAPVPEELKKIMDRIKVGKLPDEIIEELHRGEQRNFNTFVLELIREADSERGEVIKILLEKGGEVDCQDIYGKTPMDYERKRDDLIIKGSEFKKTTDEYSLDEKNAYELFKVSVREEDFETAKALIFNGNVRVTQQDEETGQTPLHYVMNLPRNSMRRALFGFLEGLRNFPEIKNEEIIPCFLEVLKQADAPRQEMANFLLEKGADYLAKDIHGVTPLECERIREEQFNKSAKSFFDCYTKTINGNKNISPERENIELGQVQTNRGYSKTPNLKKFLEYLEKQGQFLKKKSVTMSAINNYRYHGR